MANGDRPDPFVAFRFELKFDELTIGGFSECTGLQLETEVQDYAEGGLNTYLRKFPTRTKQSNLTLKRGIVDREMWDWYWELIQDGQVKYRNMTVLVKDPSGKDATIEWQFQRTLPVKWLGPDLNATQSQIAVETVELSYQGIERRT